VNGIRIARNSGDGTFTQVHVYGKDDARRVELANQVAASGINVSPAVLGTAVIMDEGMGLAIYVGVITGDSVWTVDILGAKEDAF